MEPHRDRAKKATRGAFVVLEGLDGAGTTTQCAAIAARLRAEGHTCVITREPSDGPVGTLIRQALVHRMKLPDGQPLTQATLALLFAADRVDHVAAEIEPALASGAIVLSDRYLLSSLAYQGSDLPLSWVSTINSRARVPDLTLFLAVDPKVAQQRRGERGGREELYESADQQKKIAKAYRKAIKARMGAGEKIVELDGSRPVAKVTAAALAHLRALRLA
jgi:dTMP kinase